MNRSQVVVTLRSMMGFREGDTKRCVACRIVVASDAAMIIFYDAVYALLPYTPRDSSWSSAPKQLINDGRLEKIPDFLARASRTDGEREVMGRTH